jgi:hypothetical protein
LPQLPAAARLLKPDPLGASSKISIRRAPIILSAALILFVGITACPQKTAVWIEPGSTVKHLVFNVGPKRGRTGLKGLGYLRIYPCGGPTAGPGATWVAGVDYGSGVVHQVLYGQVPPGFTASEAQPLEPGCYMAAISGTGRTRFEVRPDGDVIEIPADSGDKVKRGRFPLDSVTAGT